MIWPSLIANNWRGKSLGCPSNNPLYGRASGWLDWWNTGGDAAGAHFPWDISNQWLPPVIISLYILYTMKFNISSMVLFHDHSLPFASIHKTLGHCPIFFSAKNRGELGLPKFQLFWCGAALGKRFSTGDPSPWRPRIWPTPTSREPIWIRWRWSWQSINEKKWPIPEFFPLFFRTWISPK